MSFVPTGGGHNAGIISEPCHAGWRFCIALKRADDLYVSLAEWIWVAATIPKEGSWWVRWAQ